MMGTYEHIGGDFGENDVRANSCTPEFEDIADLDVALDVAKGSDDTSDNGALDDSGSIAVEFAFIALPFLAFLFALIETALIFFAAVSMEGAMEDAARLLRTGLAQSNNMSAEQFKGEICDRSPLFFDCDQNLIVDVRTFDNFGNVNFPDPIDVNGDLTNNFQYNPGNAGEIVLVRAFYVWPVHSPIGVGLENMSGGNRLLSASAVFRNEPFGGIL